MAPDEQGSRDGQGSSPAESRWLRYLYERHSPAELAGWARSLRLFRFCRALGGHANDGDTLQLALQFEGEDDLLALLAQLGIAVQRYPPETPQPVAGQAYPGEEFRQFPMLVPAHPSIGQPSHVSLFGVPCHVWVTSRVTITMQAERDIWHVDEAAVESAARLEANLKAVADGVADRAIDPPVENRNCLCPKFYPEIWRDR